MPDKVMTLISRIRELAASQPQKAALIFRNETMTFGELSEEIFLVSKALKERGIRRGDRVLFTALSRPFMPALYLGIQAAGAVAVFMDKSSTEERALAIYDSTEAALFLTDMKLSDPGSRRIESLAEFRKMIAGAGMESEASATDAVPEREEIAELIFTTGTTGIPKGVMLSYRAIWSIITHTREGLGIREDDVVLNPLPLFHSFGLRVLRASLAAGAVTVLQNGFGFAREVETNQENFNCTVLAAVPATFELLRKQMGDYVYEVLSRFRMIETGAGSLTLEQRIRLSEKLPSTELHNTWGSSETGGAIFAVISDALAAPGRELTLGKPLPDIEAKLLDPVRTPEGETGRLALRGEMIMSGYWKAPDQTAEALRDGFLVTGDLVRRDADGYLYMLGRADDLIKMAGETVSPIEIENVAGTCPGIAECACIGVDDEMNGQVPVLFYAPGEWAETGEAEKNLRLYLAAKLERLKMPAHYVAVEKLPRNRMEKIDRRKLKEIWESRE